MKIFALCIEQEEKAEKMHASRCLHISSEWDLRNPYCFRIVWDELGEDLRIVGNVWNSHVWEWEEQTINLQWGCSTVCLFVFCGYYVKVKSDR